MSDSGLDGLLAHRIGRRDFLGSAALATYAISAHRGQPVAERRERGEAFSGGEDGRPNILVITTDQQWAGAMSCAGNPYVQTPAMDSLACNGVMFEAAYTPNPICVPARTSYMTGTHHPVRLLDFACGSGRILSFVEGLVSTAEGVDISTGMAEVAQQRCTSATIRVGNILEDPGLLQPPYDIITCFRFLLNVENSIRRSSLRRLREVIRTPGGLLLINIHGNSRSSS